MSWSASVRVVDEDGDPVLNAKVTIFFFLGLVGDGYDTQYTDDDGWAEFEDELTGDSERRFVNHIFVNDEEVRSDFNMDDGEAYSFTLP